VAVCKNLGFDISAALVNAPLGCAHAPGIPTTNTDISAASELSARDIPHLAVCEKSDPHPVAAVDAALETVYGGDGECSP
jgi:hypothetical protein